MRASVAPLWAFAVLGVVLVAALVWRVTVGRRRPPASWRDDEASTFPAYDVPLSWDEAARISTLLDVLGALAGDKAVLRVAADVHSLGAASETRADALLYARLLNARLGAPKAVDDA